MASRQLFSAVVLEDKARSKGLNKSVLLLLAPFVLLALSACSPAEFEVIRGTRNPQGETQSGGVNGGTNSGGTGGTTGGTTGSTTGGTTGGVVCDPFDPSQNGNPINGIKGELYYLRNDQPRYTAVQDYIDRGMRARVDIFLKSINVPTRMFDAGFVTDYGFSLKDDNDLLLIEWFGLDLRSKIKLKSTDSEGLYQFAVLSDDGSLFDLMTEGGAMKTIVANDGVHPTRLACATEVVSIDRKSRIPMRFRYYQGPRFHIAAVVLWRKISGEGGIPKEPLCGQLGNELFFDPTVVPSTPKNPYLDLLRRGWKPLEPENYELESGTNPCV